MTGKIQYYIGDLESNGLRWKNNFHEVCELSIIRMADKVQISRFVKVDKVENSSFDALKIINRTLDDLRRGISKRQVVEDIERFVSEDGLTPEYRCFVGHNVISFDRKFLWQLWASQNKVFPFNLYLDTIHLTRNYAKKNQIIKPKVNLHAACEMLGVKKMAGIHTAVSDSRNTFLLLEKLMQNTDYLQHIKRIPHDNDDNYEY